MWRSDKTQDEIKKSFMNLKNNKANGEDGTRNEYIKATQTNVAGLWKQFLNSIFSIWDRALLIEKEYLYAHIQKPCY